MGKSKTIMIDFKTVKALMRSPARFEFLKIFAMHGKKASSKQLMQIFHDETGYSKNYASEIISKLKPIMQKVREHNFDVEYLKIPIKSIGEFYNKVNGG